MKHKIIGKEGMILVIVAMLAMSLAGHLFIPDARLNGEMGLFLPSPNLWQIDGLFSWGCNTGLLLAVAFGAILLNNHYNFIRSQDPVAPAVFLLGVGSVYWISSRLGASTVLLVGNFLCVTLLLGCYRKPNATQECFIVATILSLGSMIQYAFLLMVPVFFLCTLILHVMRVKETLAFLIGLVAPYWVVFGLGILSFDDFNMPQLSNIFSGFAPAADMIIILTNVGLTMIVAILATLNIEVKLFAGNSRIMALNNIIIVTGLGACIGILVDFNNMPAYLGSFYFASSFQTANVFALWKPSRPRVLLTLISLFYTGFFLASLLA